jgi:hypothetical protein
MPFTDEMYHKDPITIVDAGTAIYDVIKEEGGEGAEGRLEDPTNGAAAHDN